jgi:hypothetical protein
MKRNKGEEKRDVRKKEKSQMKMERKVCVGVFIP